MSLEKSGPEALAELFRTSGDPGFLVPTANGGTGASLLTLTKIIRLVAARCPSLSIMMTMHHSTVAPLARGLVPIPCVPEILTTVAAGHALVASAFAESRERADILDSTVECTKLESG